MTQATAGPGFVLEYDDTGSGTFTPVAEVKDIKGPEQVLASVDATNQDSANNYKEWVATLIDGGAVTFPIQLIPGNSSHVRLLTLLQDRLTVAWQIILASTGYKITFSGFVDKYGTNEPVANILTADISIKVTGPVAVVAGS